MNRITPLFVVVVAMLVATAPLAKASTDSDYAAGLNEIKQSNWDAARTQLTALSNSDCVHPVSYLLGLADAHLGHFGAAVEAELNAYGCSSPAASPFRSDALRLMEWAAIKWGNRPYPPRGVTIIDSRRLEYDTQQYQRAMQKIVAIDPAFHNRQLMAVVRCNEPTLASPNPPPGGLNMGANCPGPMTAAQWMLQQQSGPPPIDVPNVALP